MRLKYTIIFIFTFILLCEVIIAGDLEKIKEAYPDPLRFEKAVAHYQEEDEKSPPPKNAVLAYGSSSIRVWHPTITEDLAPLTIIPRGFGGSTMYDAIYFADKLVLPYTPRAILFYEGDNDISYNIAPEMIRDAFHIFVDIVRKPLPDTRIYFISIKPSISRWEMWPRMQEANALIKEMCDADPLLTFIDVGKTMLGEDGEPKPEIFMRDNLHLNADGYKLWKESVAPVLLEAEVGEERKK